MQERRVQWAQCMQPLPGASGRCCDKWRRLPPNAPSFEGDDDLFTCDMLIGCRSEDPEDKEDGGRVRACRVLIPH